MVSWKMKNADSNEHTVFQRYYHLFYKGELDELCISTGASVMKVGYDRDNHYVIIQKQ
jgi:tRNA (uracil-5-)-methyltransferase TRM9